MASILVDSNRQVIVDANGNAITDDLDMSSTFSGVEFCDLCLHTQTTGGDDVTSFIGVSESHLNTTHRQTFWTSSMSSSVCSRPCSWMKQLNIPTGTGSPGCVPTQDIWLDIITSFRGSFWETWVIDRNSIGVNCVGANGHLFSSVFILFYGHSVGMANPTCLPLTLTNTVTKVCNFSSIVVSNGVTPNQSFPAAAGRLGSVTIEDICPL